MNIRVYAKHLRYVYNIDSFIELTVDRYHMITSTMRITLSRWSEGACYLHRGFWLQAEGSTEFYTIQQVEADMVSITATAYSPHFFTGRYLIKPTLHTSTPRPGEEVTTETNWRVVGTADQAVKRWIAATDIYLGTAPEKTVGEQLTLESNGYEKLSDAIDRVLSPMLIGVRYTYEPDPGRFSFDTSDPVDKTVENEQNNPPVIFSVLYDNLKSIEYTESDIEMVNTVYVRAASKKRTKFGGVDGEGQPLDPYSVSEEFVSTDLSDTDTAGMEEKSKEAMVKTKISFTAEIYEGQNLRYRQDYDVGDIVTARVQLPTLTEVDGYYNPAMEWVTVNHVISCITEHYTGVDRSLDITVGIPDKTLPEQVKETKKIGNSFSTKGW